LVVHASVEGVIGRGVAIGPCFDGPVGRGSHSGLSSDHIDNTAHCIGSIENCLGTADDFDVVDHAWVNRIEILIGPRTEGCIVHADTINKNNDLLSGQPTNKWCSSSALGALYKDTGFTLDGLIHIGWRPFKQLTQVDDAAVGGRS